VKLPSLHRQTSELGKLIRSVFKSKAAFDIIDRWWKLDSFQSGGCVLAADAIQMAFGGELYAVASARHPFEHAVVKIGDAYYDSDGEHTAKQMLKKMWDFEELDGVLVPCPDDIQDTPRDLDVSKELAELLRARTRRRPTRRPA